MAAKTLAPTVKRGKSPATKKEEQYPYPVFSLLKDMNRMIEDFFRDFGMAPARELKGVFSPLVDVRDMGAELAVIAELPGMVQEDVDVTVTKTSLTLKGEKKAEREEKGEGFHVVERSFGSFTRTIPLPVEVNVEKTKAAFKSGVLTITLPKAEQVLKGTKKISVKTE